MAWSSWLGVLGSGGLDLGAFGAEVSSEGSKVQQVEVPEKRVEYMVEIWLRFEVKRR